MAKLLKELYNENYINLLSQNITNHYEEFNSPLFFKTIFDDTWENLELKERMRHISTTLHKYLPNNYKNTIIILKNTFLDMNYDFNLENIIFQDYVEVYGLDDPVTSLKALEHFTVNSTSEFAIRQFILKYPTQTMQQMKTWALSQNHHLRRLASEGSRPRLPWAVALGSFKDNPQAVLQILELLKNDESEYVKKSVSNNLNDISKDHPNIVKKLTQRWLHEDIKHISMLKHACRTLLKSSDKECLEIFGFHNPKNIKLKNLNITDFVTDTKELEFSFTLHSNEALGKLRVEFAIDFLRKNNSHNTKVFKISEGDYGTNKKDISKSYSFKPISTRVYYKGVQYLSIIINGVVFLKKPFKLS